MLIMVFPGWLPLGNPSFIGLSDRKGGAEISPTSRQPAVLAKLVGERVLGVTMTDRYVPDLRQR